MDTIETMYFNLISALTKTIKEQLNKTQGALRIGACNGLYTESTFRVPVQKIDKESLVHEIGWQINYLPICFLGIVTGVEVAFELKNGDDFGDVSIDINVNLITDHKYLRPKQDNNRLLEVVSEYEGKVAKVIEIVNAKQ